MIDRKKCYKQKLYSLEGGQKKVPLIWLWVASLRSGQDHINFFK